jgi:phosphoglycerate dehydrogenase-like enzyme
MTDEVPAGGVVRVPHVAFAPHPPGPELIEAVAAGGGTVVAPARADALVWLEARDPGGLPDLLAAHPGIEWVQLPFAGIEPFVGHLDPTRLWTCGKGVYAAPVAEMALGLALAGMRAIATYARARTWSPPVGTNLIGARVTVLGGGEITRAFVDLVAPFGCEVTVLRRDPEPIAGVAHVATLAERDEHLASADLVVLALALTPATRRVIDATALAAMRPTSWLVNVARGGHVDTDALVAALASGAIGGAALDVVDPEPLPDDHPLWSEPRCILTPHVGNTPEMAVPLLAERVRRNVGRFARGRALIGPVDPALGY